MRNEAVFLGATNVQVLDRGLDLIELLATAEHGMTISELVAATGLPKSTVHRSGIFGFSSRGSTGTMSRRTRRPASIRWDINL